ncbi:MAG: hypothetical protein E6R03_02710 [Hyphomicrobiaceae bacterium]|nr:MAG: hypothetical protein E6R03_02710 [Hyphomicrobiaceae bacterium]
MQVRTVVNPQIAEFLRINPLPPELDHLRPAIEKFRDVASLLGAIFELYAGGYNAAQIEAALLALDKHISVGSQRCVTCLNWTTTGDLVVCPAEQPYILSICPKCVRRFEAGQPSATMQRNFKSYVRQNGGAE